MCSFQLLYARGQQLKVRAGAVSLASHSLLLLQPFTCWI